MNISGLCIYFQRCEMKTGAKGALFCQMKKRLFLFCLDFVWLNICEVSIKAESIRRLPHVDSQDSELIA